ncbi:MAG: adenosylmethionine--8-amino-7-oxononanoate transaminase [Blastochloris sp.]|nr:adenosylmethionine--8-amino-7-oxononanoate transaminase [Blastochloris sp.]
MSSLSLTELDKRHLWHPFTPLDLWLDEAHQPIIITRGQGSTLWDEKGQAYLDGNSSIWTNLHGHARPEINDAIKNQLDRIAHSSFLGLSNELAPRLAEKLCQATGLSRCFFSDDGSTAMEAALKIVWQYFQQNGQVERQLFLSLDSAYHGDTIGAMSLGHSPVFHRHYGNLLFETYKFAAPSRYCCPWNSSNPVREEDAVIVEFKKVLQQIGPRLAGYVLEPRVQGAAGFIMHPPGFLEITTRLAREAGAKIILDEVMTGFGRTGPLFAFQHEPPTRPDLIALAKGLTGGYLPLAATLVTEEIVDGFRGDLSRTFYHGHSYTGNALGCAAALASFDLLETLHHQTHRERMGKWMEQESQVFLTHPQVGNVRREGTILAIELVADKTTGQGLNPSLRTAPKSVRPPSVTDSSLVRWAMSFSSCLPMAAQTTKSSG